MVGTTGTTGERQPHMTDVNGWVAPGWEGVRDAFTANLHPSDKAGWL